MWQNHERENHVVLFGFGNASKDRQKQFDRRWDFRQVKKQHKP